MPKTYEPIATTTLGSATATVTFSSIPSTYTDLIIIALAQTQYNGNYLGIQFNGDTGNNYSRTRLSGNGTSASSERDSSQPRINLYAQPTSNFAVNIIHIMNYANTTTYKTVLARTDQASLSTNAYAGLWRSTAAINSITLREDNLQSGSTFTLYGIKSA
jgi:hypothetical protein